MPHSSRCGGHQWKIRRAGPKERTTASACGRVPHSSRSHALAVEAGGTKGTSGALNHTRLRSFTQRDESLILVGWVSFTLRQNNGASSYQTKHRASPEGVPFKLFAFGTEVCSKCGDLLDFGNRGFSNKLCLLNTPCSVAAAVLTVPLVPRMGHSLVFLPPTP